MLAKPHLRSKGSMLSSLRASASALRRSSSRAACEDGERSTGQSHPDRELKGMRMPNTGTGAAHSDERNRES